MHCTLHQNGKTILQHVDIRDRKVHVTSVDGKPSSKQHKMYKYRDHQQCNWRKPYLDPIFTR